jgi:sec-independent protein translocase protein TatC
VALGFAFINQVMDFILAPTRGALPAGARLIYTQPGEAFGLWIQVSLIVGITLAMPYIMFQLWRLVAPIIPPGGRRFALPFAIFTTAGFLLGAAFTHFIAFPYMMKFFASFNTPELVFMPKIDEAFSLYTKLILGMGAVFEMPTLVLFLARMGVVTARMLIKYFKYAFLGIFIVAAIISPGTDIPSQLVMAVPMILLYGISIIVAFVFQKRRKPLDD